MADDYISDFVSKQKEMMETAKLEQEERTRQEQFWEERGRLIEQKAPQLWSDLREHIQSKAAEINTAGQQALLTFVSPRPDEVMLSCGSRSVKAHFNRANYAIRFSRVAGTRYKWKSLVVVPVGDDVKFAESMTGTAPLSFEDIMRGLLESFKD